LAWFESYAAEMEAVFILKYIVRQKNLSPNILHAAIRWCALFSQNENAIWRATSLVTNYVARDQQSTEALAVVRAFLLCLKLLDLSRLSCHHASHVLIDEDGSQLSFFVLNALGTALGTTNLDEVDCDTLRITHANLLQNSEIYEAAHATEKPHIYPSLIHHVAELIERSLIDLDRDRVALKRFADWMRAWPQNGWDDLDIAIFRLRRAAPSDLWDGIPPTDAPLSKGATQVAVID